MGIIRMGTSDVRIQGSDPVHQTQRLQKIEGTIDRRRSSSPILLQIFQNLVSSNRLMLLPDKFEHPAANCGEPLAVLQTYLFGIRHCPGDTTLMIMVFSYKVQFFPFRHVKLQSPA